MRILIKILGVLVIVVAILIIWLSLMEKKFSETDPGNYIRSSEALFADAAIQPQSKYIETDGPVKKVHYYEMGSGKPLILIHGGGGHAAQWYTVMEALSDSFHLYVLDRPGCGPLGLHDHRRLWHPDDGQAPGD